MTDPKPIQARSKGEDGLGMCGNCRRVDDIETFPRTPGPWGSDYRKCPDCGFLLHDPEDAPISEEIR